MRVAFCGASGTGKTTLTAYVAAKYRLPINPVGSRSVSLAMGFASPYDVDKAGKRAEFQRRLVSEKRGWEKDHMSFVTDRTTLDNLVYTMFHDIKAIDEELLETVLEGMTRYTHIIFCPVSAFCKPGVDSARVKDMTYHRLFDGALGGLIDNHVDRKAICVRYLHEDTLEARQKTVDEILG